MCGTIKSLGGNSFAFPYNCGSVLFADPLVTVGITHLLPDSVSRILVAEGAEYPVCCKFLRFRSAGDSTIERGSFSDCFRFGLTLGSTGISPTNLTCLVEEGSTGR
jgi:hypothetical protein